MYPLEPVAFDKFLIRIRNGDFADRHMVHTAKGSHKILKRCTLPLTAKGKVNLIVTEKAVLEVTKDGLLLKELMPGATLEDVVASTGAELIVPDSLKSIAG